MSKKNTKKKLARPVIHFICLICFISDRPSLFSLQTYYLFNFIHYSGSALQAAVLLEEEEVWAGWLEEAGVVSTTNNWKRKVTISLAFNQWRVFTGRPLDQVDKQEIGNEKHVYFVLPPIG